MRPRHALLLTAGLLLSTVIPVSAQTSPAAGPLRVVLQEWSVTPSAMSVPAGPVTVEAAGQGTLEHELVIVKTDLNATALPLTGTGEACATGAT